MRGTSHHYIHSVRTNPMDFLLYFYEIVSKFFFAHFLRPILKWYVKKRQGMSNLTRLLLDRNMALIKILKIENQMGKSSKNGIREICQLRLLQTEDISVYVDFILDQEGE